ncbi:MAG: type II secretion system protein [Lachnospiraceae bacterium]|nr:type II secretion system protein [Lachnospiraceae bacterium]MEE3461872.1 type II secretion system protein [Lachnospiraceae bacterium]
MRNYINSLKANEKKGFSLVELIIVIAIMAILVGVVAATVIPYLEKSRKAKDQQQISDINTSYVAALAQAEPAANSENIAIDSVSVVTELKNLLGISTSTIQATYVAKFKSKAFKDAQIFGFYNNGTLGTTPDLPTCNSWDTSNKGKAGFTAVYLKDAKGTNAINDKNSIAVTE